MKMLRVLYLSAGAVALLPTIAAAQDAQTQEIIVTARKRQESILNVPIVETAVSQKQLEVRQTTDLSDVAALVPGLSFAPSNGFQGTQVSLRGIGTSAINVGIDASVSLNIDGLQITQGTAYDSAAFDIAQVEVLKGPQSLFYGKNSPGGVIAVRTADPTDKTEVIASYGHEFEANDNRGELIVSGPLTDTLMVRVAGLYDHSDGYYRNVAIADPGTGAMAPDEANTPRDRNYLIRGTVLWKPDPSFDAKLKINYSDDRVVGSAAQTISCPDGVGAVPGYGIPFLGGNENCKLDRDVNYVFLDPSAFIGGLPNGGIPYRDTRQEYGTLELNYRPMQGLTLTSTTGYFGILTSSLANGTSSTYAGTPFASIGEALRRHEWTEEVRANSDWSGSINFTAGAFYQSATLLNRVSLPTNQDLGLPLPPTIGHYEQTLGIQSVSGFGQLRWDIFPKLELAAGGRYTHETRTLTAYNLASGSPVLFPTAVPKISANNFAPEVTLTYKPTANLTLFGSYKTGFKSGSFDLTALTTPNPDFHFGDEKVKGGEAGIKTRLLDRHLLMDIAVYDYHYSGLQVGAVVPATTGVPVNRTVNAGSARTYGVDFDLTYLPPPVPGLTLNGSVEWNHARFNVLDNVPCWGGQTIAEGCVNVLNPATGMYTAQNLDGLPLVRAPDWQASFGFTYEKPIAHEMKIVFASINQYSSRYLANLGLRDDFYQPAYFKADLSATLQGPRDIWEVSVIGKNVGNKLTSSSCLQANIANGAILGGEVTGGTGRGPAGVDELQCYMDNARQIWLRLTWKPFN
jgi:iron complex outermembrane receptor protein